MIASCVIPNIIQLLSKKDLTLILSVLNVIDNIVSLDNDDTIPIDFTDVWARSGGNA